MIVAALATGGGAGLASIPLTAPPTFVVVTGGVALGGVFSNRDDLGAVGGLILGGRVDALTTGDIWGGVFVDGEVVKVPCLASFFSCSRAGW